MNLINVLYKLNNLIPLIVILNPMSLEIRSILNITRTVLPDAIVFKIEQRDCVELETVLMKYGNGVGVYE